jgi:hypothetical protein
VRGRSVGGGGCSATLTGGGKRVNAVARALGARRSADNEHGAPRHEVRGAPFEAARRPEPCYITGRDSAFWRFSTTPMLSPVTSTGTFQ